MVTCPNADRQTSDKSIRCAVLAQKGDKWDFCIHQSFCRASGKYELKPDAADCKLKKSK